MLHILNESILVVMKWLDNQGSVTQQELVDNRDAAYLAYYADDDAAYYAYAAAYAAYYAAAATAAWFAAGGAEKYLTKYFDTTGEDRQDYIDAIGEA